MTDADQVDGMSEVSREDRNLRHSRREAVHILVAWGVCLVWTIGFSGLFGYGSSALDGAVLGIPTWVLFGVLMPWIGATLFSVWYALARIADDPLGDPSAAESVSPTSEP